jgi:uncharacterized coiled-coil DUF342 family protein
MEAVGIIKDQNEKHLQVLDEFNKKNLDQTEMADQLRDERNIYKRQFEAISVEVEEVRTQLAELEREVKELDEHLSALLVKTVVTHAENMSVAEHRKLLSAMTEGQMQGILETERIISRLQAESQTLSHLWIESQHDRLQMDKERQVVDNNLKVARNELLKKSKTIEHLRSQIAIEEVFLRKCAFQYTERAHEVVGYVGELTSLQEKTRELEAKRELMLALEYRAQRLFLESMFETQKYVALVHEFSIPRNVHRWHVLAAVDPTYVKQLRYHCLLTAKLDAAHRKLIRLVDRRNKLREKVSKAESRKTTLTANQVNNYITQYTRDIQQREEQIEELRKGVDDNQGNMRDSVKGVEAVRSKIMARHGCIARLRTKSTVAMRPQTQNTTWFFTEVPVDTMRGGGFLSRGPSQMTPDRRPQSMLNSAAGSKKITTPNTRKQILPRTDQHVLEARE